jgi:hypothetical protein
MAHREGDRDRKQEKKQERSIGAETEIKDRSGGRDVP